ncbi:MULTISPECIES: thiol-disulfide oxidoreductase DCC family protein [unclassified Streptomyces]|uniref:thiol-disulfide oxidoreductase DCC family protein n=1 Tax=unclassified Streptomyces TaxID=2593676 RepID=UPI000998BC14|nr:MULTISPECIES: DCC1-like thiol-disulfide oxidoreductase family protein [unclassified Streptomyces]
MRTPDTTAAPALPAAAQRPPVRRLTVLYDDRCALCTFVRGWLGRQRQLVPLDFVPAGSGEARRLLPGLDRGATMEEITVVGDGGQVYRGAAAWIVCLWALREHRRLAHRLSTPAGLRGARSAVLAAAKWRETGRARTAAGRPRHWGGTAYVRRDGWVYDPRAGWTYRGPGAAPAPARAPVPAPGTCDDGTCPTG